MTKREKNPPARMLIDAATTTIEQAKLWLRGHADNKDGAICPTCEQFVHIYKRTITATMARDLIRVYRAYEVGEWYHVPTVVGTKGGDFCKLRYWHLIEKMEGERPDGSSRVGWWRLRPEAVAYVTNRSRVPRHALTYSAQVLAYSDEKRGITESLGRKFDYDQLMSGTA